MQAAHQQQQPSNQHPEQPQIQYQDYQYQGQQYQSQQEQPQDQYQGNPQNQYQGQYDQYSSRPTPQPVPRQTNRPIAAPTYSVGMKGAMNQFFHNYANFRGRASRTEFWYWQLDNFLIMVVPLIFIIIGLNHLSNIYGGLSNMGYDISMGDMWPVLLGLGLLLLWALATVVPMIALFIRRFHDAGANPKLLWIAPAIYLIDGLLGQIHLLPDLLDSLLFIGMLLVVAAYLIIASRPSV
ncbi:hypothetical protein L248_0369 [Schleiferilactobacillus shenzhenensis LY-73]|uniref:DUF805 domain-containing protein n=2 Tax=Schleiferilactobacillus shenzhenensis TaxID=1231337 RepID=U4TTE9_9LACO|nr:hypothetical protein L248_0369 [Schleiferilactobacillus shenzhenensis LY-73]